MRIEQQNTSVNDIRSAFAAEGDFCEREVWIDQAIEEGLASPPSKLNVAEIMAAQRAAIG
jgi:hypothetical protein